MSSLLYLTSSKGPPATTGLPCVGVTAWFADVFKVLPSPVAYVLHTCSGRIGMLTISDRALPAGFGKWKTTASGPDAVTVFMLGMFYARFPTGSFWDLITVFDGKVASPGGWGFR